LLYVNNKLHETEIKKTIPFIITTKKCLRINSTKKEKDPYNKNDKTLNEAIEGDTKNRKTSHVHRLENSVLLRCPYYPMQSIAST
jgi:hypothetical protein